jgi:C-terminal processing protease CtpA/Prc
LTLQIIPGGFADKAGIKVGDVIVGVTGIFGGLQSVLGKGIEEV